jgi:serine/threonine protein kinase
MTAVRRNSDQPSQGATTRIEERVHSFEAAWQLGRRPVIDDYLPPEPGLRKQILVELIHADLEYRLATGEAPRIESYLERYPEIAGDHTAVLGLIRAEFEHRQRLVGPTLEEYLARFPEYRADLVLSSGFSPPRLELRGRPASRLEDRSSLLPPLTPVPNAPGNTSVVPWAQQQPTSPTRPGPTRLGRFQVLERLGSGAIGTVYKAFDTELRRLVALKLPRAGNRATAEDVRLLLKEARNAARLQHPGIVSVYGAGQIEGTGYLATEYIAGETLAQRCERAPMTMIECVALIAEVAQALDYAHEQGVIHRDIKPSNILLDLEGRPHLADFGLAKRVTAALQTNLTAEFVGTPAYMAPEQLFGGSQRADARSDVFSLGAVLFQLLTGTLPWRGVNLQKTAPALIPDPPSGSAKGRVPPRLIEICLRALCKEPAGRYASALLFADDLRRFLTSADSAKNQKRTAPTVVKTRSTILDAEEDDEECEEDETIDLRRRMLRWTLLIVVGTLALIAVALACAEL